MPARDGAEVGVVQSGNGDLLWWHPMLPRLGPAHNVDEALLDRYDVVERGVPGGVESGCMWWY